MNYQAISKVFSRNVVLEIAKKNRFDLFREIITCHYPSYKIEGKSISKIYDEMYGLLKKNIGMSMCTKMKLRNQL